MIRRLLIVFLAWMIAGVGLWVLLSGRASGGETETRTEAVNRGEENRAKKRVTLILAGDIMLGRTVMTTSLDKYDDPIYPFREVGDKLREADVVFVNLESPIVENCPRFNSGFKFCAEPRMVEGLVWAGVDVANLANNHILNFGAVGLSQTEKYLKRAGIKFVYGLTGLNLVTAEVEKKGTKFEFLGFNLVDQELSEAYLDVVREAKKRVDIVVVAVHWGVEYSREPTAQQRDWAQKLVEAGADVIAGAHPHWVQPTEEIEIENGDLRRKGMVFWSLGNFVFDQMWSRETREGLAVKIEFEEGEMVNVVDMPIYMKQWAQPQWID